MGETSNQNTQAPEGRKTLSFAPPGLVFAGIVSGFEMVRPSPRLTPWATFFRRYAANRCPHLPVIRCPHIIRDSLTFGSRAHDFSANPPGVHRLLRPEARPHVRAQLARRAA